jgi:mRNA interferase MazF
LIVQADARAEHLSITVLPATSELHDTPLLRITAEPGEGTGLQLRSQVMVDKAVTIPRVKIGNWIGQLGGATLRDVDRALAAFLGLRVTPCQHRRNNSACTTTENRGT